MSNSSDVSMNAVVMSNEDLGSSLSITTDDHPTLSIEESHSTSPSLHHVTLKDDVSLKEDYHSGIHQIDLKDAQTSAIHRITIKDESQLTISDNQSLDDPLRLQVAQQCILERDSENDE